jgi:hypothetical protein
MVLFAFFLNEDLERQNIINTIFLKLHTYCDRAHEIIPNVRIFSKFQYLLYFLHDLADPNLIRLLN